MPKVSVIIPNYNHSDYLSQRIESVLNQSYQDFELIILDDFSTDNSRAIIERYRENSKISGIVYNEKNSGSTFKQWEEGISMARGEFIWIAESDDWCEKTLLEELVSGLIKDEKCVISYCQSYCIENTNIIKWISQYSRLSEVVDGRFFIKNYMLKNNSIFNASMALWRRDYFSQISKDFKNYKFCGDWLFWIELSNLGKIHISGKVLNYFRKHDNDVSGKATKSGLNFIEALKIFNSLYKRNVLSKEEYYKAFKAHYRAYDIIKDSLDPKQRIGIEELFKNPLTSKRMYFKIFLSTLWKHIKK